MRVDDFIFECWNVDSTGWTFRIETDPLVDVVATSERLGTFRAVADFRSEVEQTLNGLLSRIKTAASNN